MRIWYTGVDNGDGSLGVEFFDCQEAIDLLEEFDPESYRGEGGHSFETNDPPLGLFRTLDEVKKDIAENSC